MGNPKVGIVILNYITHKLTIECLNNLNAMEYDNFFAVVVDNVSPNNSCEEIENHISQTKFKYDIYLLESDKNGGYSYGNNIGIKKAEKLQATYIVIMNNDIVVRDKTFLNRVVDFLDGSQAIGMIGPGIIQKKNMIELPLLPSRIGPFAHTMNNMLYPFTILRNKILRKRLQGCRKPIKVYGVSGCCFIMRASVFKEIGYFDDNLFLYGEEAVLSEKLYQSGFDIYFVPSIRVFHNHSATTGSVYETREIGRMQLESKKYYLSEYRKDLGRQVRFIMMQSDVFRDKVYTPLIAVMKRVAKRLAM